MIDKEKLERAQRDFDLLFGDAAPVVDDLTKEVRRKITDAINDKALLMIEAGGGLAAVFYLMAYSHYTVTRIFQEALKSSGAPELDTLEVALVVHHLMHGGGSLVDIIRQAKADREKLR